MSAKPVKPPRDDGPRSVFDFDRFKGQVLYVPVPNDNQLRMAHNRNMAKLKYLGSRKPTNTFTNSKTDPYRNDRMWLLTFQDMYATDDRPISLTILEDGTLMLSICRSKFFSNYWLAYAWGLQAERARWWQDGTA